MQHKENFLKIDYLNLLKELDPQKPGNWGKMNVHQMVEHMTDAFRMGNGKDAYTGILTPEERLPKAQAFILSDLPFKENTKNILMNEEPFPLRHPQFPDSLAALELEISDFFGYWENHSGTVLRNPFFGDLDYTHWVSLLYKHALHHLRQFGIEM